MGVRPQEEGAMRTPNADRPAASATRAVLSGIASAVCLGSGLSATHDALAWVGNDVEVSAEVCQYTSVTAQLSASGAVAYTAYGNCSGFAMSGNLSFEPLTQRY